MVKARDPGAWMWARARQLLEEAEQIHRTLSELPSPSAMPGWAPPLDVFETPTELWVLIALPGVDPDEVEVRLEESALVVRGSRSVPDALRRAIVHRMEIPTGRFERVLPLSPGPWELRTRDFVDGCLFLSLAKPT
jgi:HSP20 family molecular chaperone IbpA